MQRPARHRQELERFVEARGVGGVRRADREDAFERSGEHVALHHALAGAHPVLVALHGVDLAVVGEHPVRVRERPRRERVRAEARVHEAERRLEPVVPQVAVEVLDLARCEHALVDDDAGRERREVRVGRVLDPLAGRVDVTFEGVAGESVLGDEHLTERGEHFSGARTRHVGADRDLAPAEDAEAFVDEHLLDLGDDRVGVRAREEGDAGRVLPCRRQFERDDRAVERIGDLQQDARTVAGIGFGAGRAPVGEVAQRRERLVDQAPALAALHVDDEAHATAVVLEARVVEPLRRGQIAIDHSRSSLVVRWLRGGQSVRSIDHKSVRMATAGRHWPDGRARKVYPVGPIPALQNSGPPCDRTPMDLAAVAPAFVEMAHRIVWCSAATVDARGRPRSRILHPLWRWEDGALTGWIATGPTPLKRAHLAAHPYVSLTYWAPDHDTCTAECGAELVYDDATRTRSGMPSWRRPRRSATTRRSFRCGPVRPTTPSPR